MVVLVANARIKPEFLNDFIAAANDMIAPSRAEAACITYDFFTRPGDETHLVFVEEWESGEGLQAHFQEPHFLRFVEVTGPMLESSELKVYTVSQVDML